MPKVEQFAVPLPTRHTVQVIVLELSDGRIVARTADELAHAPDEERLAAGLLPHHSQPGAGT